MLLVSSLVDLGASSRRWYLMNACNSMQDFGTKLNTVATVLDDTGLTLLDLKTAKMVSGTEEGLTVRKFLIAAPPGKILDLTKLQLKVHFAAPAQVIDSCKG